MPEFKGKYFVLGDSVKESNQEGRTIFKMTSVEVGYVTVCWTVGTVPFRTTYLAEQARERIASGAWRIINEAERVLYALRGVTSGKL